MSLAAFYSANCILVSRPPYRGSKINEVRSKPIYCELISIKELVDWNWLGEPVGISRISGKSIPPLLTIHSSNFDPHSVETLHSVYLQCQWWIDLKTDEFRQCFQKSTKRNEKSGIRFHIVFVIHTLFQDSSVSISRASLINHLINIGE